MIKISKNQIQKFRSRLYVLIIILFCGLILNFKPVLAQRSGRISAAATVNIANLIDIPTTIVSLGMIGGLIYWLRKRKKK